MGHSIQAFIGKTTVLAVKTPHLQHAHVVDLAQEFSLLPVTDELHDEVIVPGKLDLPYPEFWKLSCGLLRLALDMSRDGPVAYVETDYHGGVGSQAAILYENETISLGPLHAKRGPINAVLQHMGVIRGDARDEFETIGLSRYRSNEDWIEHSKE